MRVRPRCSSAIAALIALALAGCGSSGSSSTATTSSLASKSPAAILASVSRALGAISGVHMFGSEVSGGRTLSLDLHLVAGKGGVGTISIGAAKVQLVVVGGYVYMNGNAAFWDMLPGAGSAAKLLADRWLRTTQSGSFGTFADLTDTRRLFATTLGNHGTLSNRGLSTVDSRRVVALHDDSKNATLYVAATGAPVPVEIIKPGGSQSVTFNEYNQPVSLSVPAKWIDISKLAGGAGPFG